jgi:hypothetical protein
MKMENGEDGLSQASKGSNHHNSENSYEKRKSNDLKLLAIITGS